MSSVLRSLANQGRSHAAGRAIESGLKSLTWGVLAREVARLADRLAGVGSVAIVGDDRCPWIVADLAALRARSCCIPVPPFFSDPQVRHLIADSNPELVLVLADGEFDTGDGYRQTGELVVAGARVRVAERIPDGPPSTIPPGVAKVTYTSGTTGTPKGVMLTAAALEAVTRSLALAARGSAADRALVSAPPAILLENIASVYVPVLCGATILAGTSSSPQAGAADIERLATDLPALRPTTAVLAPAALRIVADAAARRRPPGSLRFVAVGGAPLPAELIERSRGLGIPAYEGYGLSEASSVVCLNTPTADRPGSVGRPLPHCRVRIDADGGIRVAGSGFMGYLGDRGESGGDEIDTGDLGRIDDDGYLYVVGRRRDVIITAHGRNVSPEWLEAELCARPGILQAAVAGDGRPYLTAIIVASEPQAAASAVAACNRVLPRYARIERFILAERHFARSRGELTGNGRLRRDVVLKRYRQQLESLYGESDGQVFRTTP